MRLTARQKAFCRLYHTGMPRTQAYEQAGYRPNSWNSWGILQKPQIQREIRRLEERAMKRHDITVEKVLTDLERALKLAEEERQATAMVGAAMAEAKLVGLITDKVERRDVAKMDASELVKAIREQFGEQADTVLATVGLLKQETETEAADKTAEVAWPDFTPTGTVQ